MATRTKIQEGRAAVKLRIKRPIATSELECEVTEDRAMLVYLLCIADLTSEQLRQADTLLASLRGPAP